ncbi:MAG: glycosyltransferase [Rikenellaceae bacterium]|jgi:hypothetical protein|nr:glycosyltransferase [Rikenellaceae bacterium]
MNVVKYFRLRRHRNGKFGYYLACLLSYMLPDALFRRRLSRCLAGADEAVARRADYYNRLDAPFSLPDNTVTLKGFTFGNRKRLKTFRSAYFFDTVRYTRYFSPEKPFAFLFGDVTTVPEHPSVVKSRPVEGDNRNSVLLNLDRARHFVFLKDGKPFRDKRDMLVGRAAVYPSQSHRVRFWEMYFGHPLCDLGQVNRTEVVRWEWVVRPMPIDDHLDYKFILCLEGNDVATNLKWVMSSNSVAVMPRPKYETWFMEGSLIGGVHYIEIRSDYSDLEQKLKYYIDHPEEAERIVENAHRHVAMFQDKRAERRIALAVLKKYFELEQSKL